MGYQVLYNFISPVTGRILCDTDKVLVGDARGIAIPSTFIPIGALPDLPMGNIWIGNDMNRPIPNPTISIDNLPELLNGNLWIGDIMNRPVISQTITIDNLPNLSSGKVWIGNGMIPSRPVEGTPPQGPPGPPGPEGAAADPNNLANSAVDGAAGSLVKFGLEQLFKGGAEVGSSFFKAILGISVAVDAISSLGSTIIDGVKLGYIAAGKDSPTPYIDYRTFNTGNNSLIGARGAEGLSGVITLFISANLDLRGSRLENISPSPGADYDAVPAKWVWDLLNDNVEIIWAN
jgi:hypothetical protein